jgi:DNA-binding response OmpR family regulator
MSDAPESLRGLRILLVEDDPLICLDLETSLADLGADVKAASDIAGALHIMATSKLDFAVLDFELGVETSEPIARAAQARNVQFLYLSGYSERDGHFTQWPSIDVLVKPISAVTIARRIQERLSQRK